MRIKEWRRDVFVTTGTFQRVCFWITFPAAIVASVAGLLPSFLPHIPVYARLAPLVAFIVAFAACNISAYSRVLERAETAEGKLKGVSIDVVESRAFRNVQEDRARVYVRFVISLRNHSDTRAAIELAHCTSDMTDKAGCDGFTFEGPDAPGVRNSTCRTLEAGTIRTCMARVYFDFADKTSVLPVETINGTLTLRDHRKELVQLPFSASVSKEPETATITIPMSKFQPRRSNWVTGYRNY